MDKKQVKEFHEDMSAALKGLAQKYGIQLKKNNCSYDDLTVRFTVAFDTAKPQDLFSMYAVTLGLHPDDFGKTFKVSGDTFKIVGCKPESPKYAIIVERHDGKRLFYSTEAVIRHLKTS